MPLVYLPEPEAFFLWGTDVAAIGRLMPAVLPARASWTADIGEQLGAPASWNGDGAPADMLGPMVRAAAENARRIAMVEAIPADECMASITSEAPVPPKIRKAAKAAGRRKS